MCIKTCVYAAVYILLCHDTARSIVEKSALLVILIDNVRDLSILSDEIKSIATIILNSPEKASHAICLVPMYWENFDCCLHDNKKKMMKKDIIIIVTWCLPRLYRWVVAVFLFQTLASFWMDRRQLQNCPKCVPWRHWNRYTEVTMALAWGGKVTGDEQWVSKTQSSFSGYSSRKIQSFEHCQECGSLRLDP